MTDYNSNKNQDIKSKFVEREVYCNVNQMVEYILSTGYENASAPFTYDDIENYYTYPECGDFEGGTEDDKNDFLENKQEEADELHEQIYDLEDELSELEERDDLDAEEMEEREGEIQDLIDAKELELSELQELIADVANIDSEPSEIFEWWQVSDWLASKLEEQGECVISSFGLWGRCTTGQAILLDGVISRICSEMEILEGQKNEWLKDRE